ncbi:hypothetical protein T4B_5477 [Trichinella pseudospiralis]|uniref:Uncharacterized protein n=1 Tax=Trichinella pseudospiralis TaxID=6337 RepID=A0A0V1GKI7_TRIPS|nr:hypothetical protein T4B_5477 [Trichinella pseudospiralis]
MQPGKTGIISLYLENYSKSINIHYCDLLVLRKWRKTCFQNLDLF